MRSQAVLTQRVLPPLSTMTTPSLILLSTSQAFKPFKVSIMAPTASLQPDIYKEIIADGRALVYERFFHRPY